MIKGTVPDVFHQLYMWKYQGEQQEYQTKKKPEKPTLVSTIT